MKKDKWRAKPNGKVYFIVDTVWAGGSPPKFSTDYGVDGGCGSVFHRSHGEYPTKKELKAAIARIKKAML